MNEPTTSLVLENVVIRYPHLVELWSGSPSIDPDYSCQIIFPDTFTQWKEVQECCQRAAIAKFGNTLPPNMKYPWLNKYLQPNLQKDGPYEGKYCMTASGKGTKPGVVGPDAKEIPDLQIKQLIFSGCICHVYVNFYGYTQGPGVTAALQGVQLINNQVVRIADAGRDVTKVFQAIPGAPPALVPANGGQNFQGPNNTENPPW